MMPCLLVCIFSCDFSASHSFRKCGISFCSASLLSALMKSPHQYQSYPVEMPCQDVNHQCQQLRRPPRHGPFGHKYRNLANPGPTLYLASHPFFRHPSRQKVCLPTSRERRKSQNMTKRVKFSQKLAMPQRSPVLNNLLASG